MVVVEVFAQCGVFRRFDVDVVRTMTVHLGSTVSDFVPVVNRNGKGQENADHYGAVLVVFAHKSKNILGFHIGDAKP